MTDDERHAEVITVLEEIRDAVRELGTRPPTINPANSFGAGGLLGEIFRTAAAARGTEKLGTWAGDIDTVEGERLLLRAAGALWEWQPGIKRVKGPLCPSTRTAMLYQSSAGLPPCAAVDALQLGPAGWMVCPDCGHVGAVPTLGVTIGSVRTAVETGFRGRLGLAAKR